MAETWLSENLVVDILQDEYGEKFKINEFSTEKVVADTEHFGCYVKRLNVKLQLTDEKEITKHYIVKSAKDDPHSGRVNTSTYPKERDMYIEIIPKFETLFKEETGERIQFGPTCHKKDDETESLFLEDLKDRAFLMDSRQWGMDLKHAEAVLEKLAQFHAASARLFERDGPYSDQFREGMYVEHMIPIYANMFQGMWGFVESSMQRWTMDESLKIKLKRQRQDMISYLMESLACDPTEFNVLNHGDFWINNIMFQYNSDDSIKEVLFIDFQLSKWGSPTQDLLHFLVTSCSRGIRVVKFEHLIAHYHDHLCKNLKLLKYKGSIPTLDDLQKQLRKRGYYGISTALSVLPAVLREPQRPYMKSYANEKYFEAMKALVPYFDELGLLDKTPVIK